LLFGITLLVALYFDLRLVVYGLICLTLFEAITNLRVPRLISRLTNQPECDPDEGCLGVAFKVRTGFEAERALRLLVALFLLTSLEVFPDPLWFFPWFMGFALLGAGISGVCPMFLALKWAGLK
jgi:hypothetical protein